MKQFMALLLTVWIYQYEAFPNMATITRMGNEGWEYCGTIYDTPEFTKKDMKADEKYFKKTGFHIIYNYRTYGVFKKKKREWESLNQPVSIRAGIDEIK